MTTQLKFNVFGKVMSVYKTHQGWQLYNESDTGIRARVYDVVIPDDLTETQLEGYLDDIYHEYSSNKHPKVVAIK